MLPCDPKDEFVLGGEPNPANPGANSAGLLPTGKVVGSDFVFTFTRINEAAYLNPVSTAMKELVQMGTEPATDGTAPDWMAVTPYGGIPDCRRFLPSSSHFPAPHHQP